MGNLHEGADSERKVTEATKLRILYNDDSDKQMAIRVFP